MTHAEFVHLHNHTEYSLLDGACRLTDDRGKPAELFHLIAKEYKMPALAITDHGNMYGAMEFYWASREMGIKPIVGCEVYVAPGSRFDRKLERGGDTENYYHLTLLARDVTGYQNLMHLVSLGFLEGFYYKPRVDRELLRKFHEGIIALSGCLAGEVANNLLKERFDKAEQVALELQDIFGKDYFYLEVMDNGLEEQQRIIPHLMELSKKLGIPLVATNDCHFLKKEDAYDHDVLLCIGMGKTLDDPGRMKFSSDQFYYRSPDEMAKTFNYLPEAIKNTVAVAEKVNLDVSFDQLQLPHYPVPEGETAETYLAKLCTDGMKRRYGDNITDVHTKRLAHELNVINKMGFAAYFLIVWDFIHYSKTHGIPVGPGRGSGAGSMVAYTLGITDICPLHYHLLFERFLNPERRSMPDLDIDFADAGREQVIQYVRDKYGHNNCAQIITFGSMQARLVIRDVARAMGFTPAEGDRVAKMIPFGSNIYAALDSVPELKALSKSDPRVGKLLKTSMKLEGLKRHTGVHAAGMLIAKEEITKFSPLAKGSRDVVTTQYDGAILPKLGLLKVDFLGLRTLTIIDDTIKLIHSMCTPDFDIDTISLEDPVTFKLLFDAKTLGVFQLESRGMRDLLRKIKPSNIEDIIAVNALYRPGPMGSGMIDDFVACKLGQTKVRYDHPVLEPILKETYGVILYQEQVMRISMDMGGFTAGQADGLRKAMGKKIPEEIEKQRGKFLDGAKAKGIDKKLAEKVFDNIVKFGGYGFNKSHAAAYGVVSFRTAYLKANYPLQYMTALLNSEIGHSAIGKEEEECKLVTYAQEAETMDIKILPPDIQMSETRFAIEGPNIRFGLVAIKNVGEGAVESIIEARRQKGKFKSWEDFISRIDIHAANRKVLESLIKAGACDCFGENRLATRAELMAKLDTSLDWAGSQKQDLSIGQGLLFDAQEFSASLDANVKVEPWSEHTALANEKEVLGFYLSGHPLAQHRLDLLAYSQYRLDRLPPAPADSRGAPLIRIVGMISSAKKLITKEKKEQYARFKLEDLHGEIEVVVFPKSYRNGLAKYITLNNIVVVKGRLSCRETESELLAEEIMTLEDAKRILPSYVGAIRLKLTTTGLDNTLLDRIKAVIKQHPGQLPVFLDIAVPGQGDYTIETTMNVKYEQKFFQEIEKVLGPECWELRSA
jgi:DNA polymerase-3 subunit alpha